MKALLTLYLASITLLLFCMSCADQELACTFDSECGDEQMCVNQSCYATCVEDEDCNVNSGLTCRAVDRGADTNQLANVCAQEDFVAPGNSISGTTCEDDAVCQQLFADPRARCSLLSSCIIPAEEQAILVIDRSDRGGAELIAAYIEDAEGTQQLQLSVESYVPTEPATVPAGWNHPPSQLDAEGACLIDPTNASTLPLEGGQVRLILQNESEGRQRLEEGWRVVIVEQGATCMNQDDAIDVALCISLAGDELDSSTQCTRILTKEGTGRTTAMISFDSFL